MSRLDTSRVLLVDDEAENLDLLIRTLRGICEIASAKNVAEARRLLASVAIDVIVTDYRLPDGLGTELIREAHARDPLVGRVLITAYGENPDVLKAHQDGLLDRFFLKPAAPARVRSAVLDLLQRRGTVQVPTVLVVDDDDEVRDLVVRILSRRSFRIVEAVDGEDAILQARDEKPDVVLLDVNLPKIDGLGVLKTLHTNNPSLPVVMMTAASPELALNFFDAGCFDVLNKPFKTAEVLLRTERASQAHRQTQQLERMRRELEAIRKDESIVAESDSMRRVLKDAERVAEHSVSVVITGETGSGKEVVARTIHRCSKRADAPFIPVNCGAIPEGLIESELFGHEKGAFTGAHATKKGFFEAAHSGTLFLDEVGELSEHAQVGLLRVLERREFHRVGGNRLIHSDVRIIAATHRDLGDRVERGEFRADLYYRLNGFSLHIPPLRERPEDLRTLLLRATGAFCARNGLPMPEITEEAIEGAMRYEWPGNVRELLNVVERTLITRGATRIDELEISGGFTPHGTVGDVDTNLPLRDALGPAFERLERHYLTEVLKRHGGKLGLTAKHAGIHRKSLYNKMKQLGMSHNED